MITAITQVNFYERHFEICLGKWVPRLDIRGAFLFSLVLTANLLLLQVQNTCVKTRAEGLRGNWISRLDTREPFHFFLTHAI